MFSVVTGQLSAGYILFDFLYNNCYFYFILNKKQRQVIIPESFFFEKNASTVL